MPPTLEHVLGLTALIQCLVYDLSQEIDRGTYQYDCHPFMVRQNKWRACRYGMDANLVDPGTYESIPARQVVHGLIDRLEPRGEELGCAADLRNLRQLLDQPTGSMRQLQVFAETNNLAEVVRRMISLTEPAASASAGPAR
jgi:carboxylate-amine ligase